MAVEISFLVRQVQVNIPYGLEIPNCCKEVGLWVVSFLLGNPQERTPKTERVRYSGDEPRTSSYSPLVRATCALRMVPTNTD